MNHPGHPAQPVGPTTWQKFKMGAFMGGCVGATIGFLFGSFAVIRGGAGPRGFMGTVSQYMLSSAATFATFMSIGSVIRTDDPMLLELDRRNLGRLQLVPATRPFETASPLRERMDELKEALRKREK
ncbi:hypothetical protein BT69DRAFT_1256665 [Atractiella rhizophila]|nr:hypothetical protein BT69DRAFT_1256665 [Atractiella rhizophila]